MGICAFRCRGSRCTFAEGWFDGVGGRWVPGNLVRNVKCSVCSAFFNSQVFGERGPFCICHVVRILTGQCAVIYRISCFRDMVGFLDDVVLRSAAQKNVFLHS